MDDKLIKSDKTNNRKDLIIELIEIVTRVDERVRVISEAHLSTIGQIHELSELVGDLDTKLQVLDSQMEDIRNVRDEFKETQIKVNLLETTNTNQEHRWKAIFSFSVQLIWVIIASYILYKLGIQSPPVP